MQQPTVFTIGHSSHPIDEFIDLLRTNGVQQLVDVRTVPGSRQTRSSEPKPSNEA